MKPGMNFLETVDYSQALAGTREGIFPCPPSDSSHYSMS